MMTLETMVSEFDDAYYVATDTMNTKEEREEAMRYIRQLFDGLVDKLKEQG